MEMIDWALWALLETAKYMILTYAILGFKPREGKRKYLVFLYVVIGVLLVNSEGLESLLYTTLWGLVLISIFFKGKWLKKVQAFLLEEMLISAVDIVMWCMIASVTDWSLEGEHYAINWLADSLGVLVWIGIVIGTKKYRVAINRTFQDMTWKYYSLIFAALLATVSISAFAQGHVSGELRNRGEKIVLGMSVMAVFCVIMIIVVMAYMWQKKNQLEIIQELTQRCYDYQKNYYEGIIRKDEELRRFRHDIRKHMGAIAVLCEEGKTEKVQNYIRELQGDFEELTVCRTGNAIADYFINQMIEEMRACGNFDYTVTGRFPAELRLTESDLCILLGNAMDNAKEALLKCEGERTLSIEIKSYKDRLYLTVANSTVDSELDLTTSKQDKENHGYGIKNMERVTEKYGGKIEYTLGNGMFVLKIEV